MLDLEETIYTQAYPPSNKHGSALEKRFSSTNRGFSTSMFVGGQGQGARHVQKDSKPLDS